MQKVFISYSHVDSYMADRLAVDLRESEVPATYDKWLLRVGDSIIQKISEAVEESSSVIALLSPASIKSNWVKKELAFAMTSEIQNRKIKVLPALLKNCKLPPMLADKHYADFRYSYYQGLRKLLESLCPEFYERGKFIKGEQIERAQKDLTAILNTNNLEAIRDWFQANGFALAALFGRLWAVSEAIPRFGLGTEFADFVIINGQSFNYEVSLIMLGDPTWSRVNPDELIQQVQHSQQLVQWCRENDDNVRRALAIRMASTYGAEQIAPDSRCEQYPPSESRYQLEIDAKLLCGRRTEYGPTENNLRNNIYINSNKVIEIISYDRVLDVLDKVRRW